MEDTPLASLSLTHVHYDPADPISYFCAWLALVPQGLCVTYITLIWATREVEIMLLFAGQMGCEALNFLLKRLIKEERPQKMCGKGYGMPSSHAQFLTFFSLSLTFFLLLRQRPSPPVPLSPTIPFALPPYVRKIVVSLGAMAVAAAVSASRVYLSYHTSKQVLVGCTAGAVSAVAWFAATEWARREGWVEWLLGWWVMKLARVRDLVVDEDVWESGWREWEGRKAGSRRQERGLKSKKAGKNS